MKVPKVPVSHDEDLDEEDYEEREIVHSEEAVCRVLVVILLDNNYYSTIIDENTDTLSYVRENLSPFRKIPGDDPEDFRFSYQINEKLEVIPPENESLTIKELIELHHIKSLVVHEKIILYLYKEEVRTTELVSDPDEIFREYAKITYMGSHACLEKIVVGKLFPKPEVVLLSASGEEEGHIKLKEVNFSSVNETTVEFSTSSE